jgi:hypothetical protein
MSPSFIELSFWLAAVIGILVMMCRGKYVSERIAALSSIAILMLSALSFTSYRLLLS